MVNKALVLENRRSMMERKQKRQNQQNNNAKPRIGSSSAGPAFCLSSNSSSKGSSRQDKATQPCSIR
jgi:hypothetical protein